MAIARSVTFDVKIRNLSAPLPALDPRCTINGSRTTPGYEVP